MVEPREFAAKVCSEKFNDFVHLLFVPELFSAEGTAGPLWDALALASRLT